MLHFCETEDSFLVLKPLEVAYLALAAIDNKLLHLILVLFNETFTKQVSRTTWGMKLVWNFIRSLDSGMMSRVIILEVTFARKMIWNRKLYCIMKRG